MTTRRVWLRFAVALAFAFASAVAYSGVRVWALGVQITSYALPSLNSGEGEAVDVSLAAPGALASSLGITTYTVSVTNSRPFSLQTLPNGSVLNAITGQLTGTLAAGTYGHDPVTDGAAAYAGSEGIYDVTVHAWNGATEVATSTFTWDISRWANGDVFVGGGNRNYSVYSKTGALKYMVKMSDSFGWGATLGCAANWKTGEVWAANLDYDAPGVGVITRHADSDSTVYTTPATTLPYTSPSRQVNTARTSPAFPGDLIDHSPESVAFDDSQNMYVVHAEGFAPAPDYFLADATGAPVLDANNNFLDANQVEQLYADYSGGATPTFGIPVSWTFFISPSGFFQLWTAGTQAYLDTFGSPGTFLRARRVAGNSIHKYAFNPTTGKYDIPGVYFDVDFGFKGPTALDLLKDQQTVIYSTETPYVYRYNTAGAGAQMQVLGRATGPDPAADYKTQAAATAGVFPYSVPHLPIYTPDRSMTYPIDALPVYGVRALPPGDGSGGYLVVNEYEIDRVDGNGRWIQSYDVLNNANYPYQKDIDSGHYSKNKTKANYSAPGDVNGWYSLSLAPDGTSFWAASRYDLFHFDIASGQQIGAAIHIANSDLGTALEVASVCVMKEYHAADPNATCGPTGQDPCTARPVCTTDANGTGHMWQDQLNPDGSVTRVEVPYDASICAPVFPPGDVTSFVAVDDAYSTEVNTQLSVAAASDVLTNDQPPAGTTATVTSPLVDPLRITTGNAVTNPGTLTQNADGTLVYTPAAGFVGEVSYSYRAINSNGILSGTAKVTIKVNKHPVAVSVPDVAVDYGSTFAVACDVSASGWPAGYVPPTTMSYTGQSRDGAVYSSSQAPTRAGTYQATCSFAGDDTHDAKTGTGVLTIRPAHLTVTAADTSHVYGGANPVVTAAISGFVNGDTVAAVTGAAVCTTSGAAGPNAGTYAGANSCTQGTLAAWDYDFPTFTAGTLTITPAALTITAGNGTMIYGGTVPAIAPGYSGFVNGDTAASLTTAPTCSAGATSASPVGSYASSCSGAVDANYTITYPTGTVTVTAAHLTVTAADTSRVYGAANPAVTAAISGFVNGDTAAVVSGAATCTTSGAAGPNVGVYAGANSCTQGTLAAANYDFPTYAAGTLTITAASSVTTVTCTGTPIYSGLAQTPCTATVTGVGLVSATLTPTYTNNVNAGTGTATASASYPGDVNHTGSSDTATFSIAKAPVIATAGGGTATYDGTAKTPAACVVTGTYTGDLTCANNPASVGPAAGTTSIDPVTSGTGLGNFAVTNVAGSYTIGRKQATATAPDAHAVYNGGAVAGSGTCSDGLTPVIAYTPGPGAPVNAGTTSYTVTCGDGGQNYLDGTATGSIVIDKARATVTVTPYHVTYNGASHTATAIATGVGGADLSAQVVLTGTSHTNAGDYAADAWTFTGGANYNDASGTVHDIVDKAPLTITAGNGTMVYGGTVPAIAPSYSGFVSGDTVASLTTAPTCSAPVTSASPVGSYASSCSGAVAANYAINYATGTVTVTAAPSTTTVTCTGTPTYSGVAQTPCTATVTGVGGLSETLTPSYTNNVDAGAGTATASASYAGDLNHLGSSDTATFSIAKAPVTATAGGGTSMYDTQTKTPSACVVTGTFTGDVTCTNSPASVGPGAGTTTIVPVAISANLGNFDVTNVPGAYTINKAPSQAFAPAVTTTYTGSAVFGPGSCSNGLAAQITYSGGSAPVSAGQTSYTVACGNDNYLSSTATGSITIGQATPTATATGGTFTYDAQPHAGTCTVAGVGTDVLTGTLSYSSSAAPVAAGTYTVTCSFAGDVNYAPATGTATITIAKAAATATAGGGTKVYGTADPALTATSTGFVAADNITVSATRAAGDSVGSYVTTATATGDLANYDVNYVPGSFTITKAALSVIVADKTRSYGDPNPTLTGTLTGVVAGDGITASYSTTAIESSPVGTYPITATLEDPNTKLGNYNVTNTSGTLTITDATPVCSTATARPSLLWPPNHKMVAIRILGVTDPNGKPITIRVTSIFQDEPTNTTGDGDTAIDGAGIGTNTAYVRAERVGDRSGENSDHREGTHYPGDKCDHERGRFGHKPGDGCEHEREQDTGNGRVYHIRFTATAGTLSCNGDVTVGVPHDQGQRDTAIDDGPLYNSTTESLPAGHFKGDGCRDGDHEEGKPDHFDGDKCDHELGKNGHKKGDRCDHERMKGKKSDDESKS